MDEIRGIKMSLFGKKKNIRFESITLDRQRDIFKALESRGWTQCSEAFSFDLDRTTEKLRKDAMAMARDLKADLLIETWDPIYHNRPYKGLSYSVWRPMTQDEINKKRMLAQTEKRPNYSDSLGTIQARPKATETLIDEKDIEAMENIVDREVLASASTEPDGGSENGPSRAIDMGSIEVVSADDPYKRRTEPPREVRKEAMGEKAGSGPVFDEEMKLEFGVPEESDPTSKIDAMALMAGAAEEEKTAAEKEHPEEEN